MNMRRSVLTACAVLLSAWMLHGFTVQPPDIQTDEETLAPEERLAIIWTSGDREVALKMVFMYTYNSMRFEWWKDITLVVWGNRTRT